MAYTNLKGPFVSMSKTRNNRPSLLEDISEEEVTDAVLPSEDDQRQVAFDILLEAWQEALSVGVEPDIMAQTAIHAALSDMVDFHGEDEVAELASGLEKRVQYGEFSLQRTQH
ncbi:MAG: hypothetical protein ACJAXQ_001772 [Parvibaculaceae bacterium]|jgi:hypothetical protein